MPDLLTTVLKLYTTAMMGDVRSPIGHIFGPPGCGKSTVVQQAADLLGVKLHIINVSRISPLELEGVMMPIENNTKLHLLTSTYWSKLNEGDIILFDEFLRGFPEVFNGLLDIFTSREVGGFKLPKVFIIAASNSTVTYDPALEDRLMHLVVPDLRKVKAERERTARLMVEQLGLLPTMAKSMEMQSVIDTDILPTYEMLDQIGGKITAGSSTHGCSVRNLIGQVQLRHVTSSAMRELIDANNRQALRDSKPQYVVLIDTKYIEPKYISAAAQLKHNSRLTQVQRLNLEVNLQLISMAAAQAETIEEETTDDDDGILAV